VLLHDLFADALHDFNSVFSVAHGELSLNGDFRQGDFQCIGWSGMVLFCSIQCERSRFVGNSGGASEGDRRDRAARTGVEDPSFGHALVREGIDTMLAGDVDAGKAILRDYIKATIGFEKVGEATETPPKSLIRMFRPRGNPQARNLFSVIGYLQKRAGLELRVTAGPG